MDVYSGRWTPTDGWSDVLPDWDGASTLVLLFGPSSLLDEPDHVGLRDLRTAYPGSALTGCSTAGEVRGAELADGSLTVAVLRFAATRVVLETAVVSEAESGDVGRLLGKHLAEAGDDLAAVVVLSEGLSVNGSALAGGLTEGVPPGVVVVGGLAGDGDRFARTWVLVDGVPTRGRVSAVGLFGDRVDLGHGSGGGWSVLGPERLVTRSVGPVLHELDGRPALELYCTYLGDRARGLPATALLFPLGIRLLGSERDVVRTVLGVDPVEQTLTFAGDVPEGAVAQLMRSTTDRLVDAAEDAAGRARPSGDADHDGDALALVVSCVGRRLYLGQRCEEELEAVTDALGPRVRSVGFYSYGELATPPAGGVELQNQTMTVSVLRERARP